MIDAPTIGFIITTALLDSINPFAIEVLLFMTALWLGRRMPLNRVALLSLCYIVAIFSTYLIAGFGMTRLLAAFPAGVAQLITIIVGALVVLAGLFELKEFFWGAAAPLLRFPSAFASRIKMLSRHASRVYGIVLLGIYMALVELICTGAPYFGAITVFKNFPSLTGVWLIVAYNAIFILPFLAIVILILTGVKISAVQKWSDESKSLLRLGAGFLLIILGWILMLIANGVMNFG